MTNVANRSNPALLDAIDVEHRDIVKAANAIYDERMKPERKQLEAARRSWEAAQRGFRAAEQRVDGERRANMEEARTRRTELRQAVTSARPVKMADIVKVKAATAKIGEKVTVARVSMLEARA